MTPRSRQTSLERVAAVGQMIEATQRELWSSHWPMGYCAVTSLLSAPLLRCADDAGGWRVAVGVVAATGLRRWRVEYDWRRTEPFCHAWCESAAGDIWDPTYGQFDGGDPAVVLPAHQAGDLGHYASWVMTLDEEEDARRSISSRRFKDGWTAQSSVRTAFARLGHGW